MVSANLICEFSVKYGLKMDQDNTIAIPWKIQEIGDDPAVMPQIRDTGPGFDDEVLEFSYFRPALKITPSGKRMRIRQNKCCFRF